MLTAGSHGHRERSGTNGLTIFGPIYRWMTKRRTTFTVGCLLAIASRVWNHILDGLAVPDAPTPADDKRGIGGGEAGTDPL
jgi:hypothetical protein